MEEGEVMKLENQLDDVEEGDLNYLRKSSRSPHKELPS